MSAKTIRRKYLRDFIGLTKYSQLVSWTIIAAYVGQIIVAVLLGHQLVSMNITIASGLLIVVVQTFIATRLRGLNNIGHECSHASFSRVREENERIGKFCASLSLGSFFDYRDEHLSHHMYLGDYDKDQDFHGIKKLRLEEPLSRPVVLRHLLTPFLGRHLPYYTRINLNARDGRFFQLFKVSLLFCAIAFSVVSPVTGVLFIIAPYLFFYSALNYWADCLDHAGIVTSTDDLEASRNLVAPKWLRWLFFPRNDSFHLVHHLFPQVPARHLQSAHELLKQDPEYASHHNAVPRGRVKAFAAKPKSALARV